MGWAVRVGYKAAEVVTGADQTGTIVAETTGVSTKKKWVGGELRARVTRQGSGWIVENGSPYGSYANTPVGGSFIAPGTPMSANGGAYSPLPPGTPGSAANGSPYGLGLGLNTPAPGHNGFPASPYASQGSYPASPHPASPASFPLPQSPMPPVTGSVSSPGFAAQQTVPPPPKRGNSLGISMNGKKSD
jgi:hypothetical protein